MAERLDLYPDHTDPAENYILFDHTGEPVVLKPHDVDDYPLELRETLDDERLQ
jgi:hypothetical protein